MLADLVRGLESPLERAQIDHYEESSCAIDTAALGGACERQRTAWNSMHKGSNPSSLNSTPVANPDGIRDHSGQD